MQDNQQRRYFSIRSSLFICFCMISYAESCQVVSDVKCEKREPKPVHTIVQCLKLSNTNTTVGVCDIHSSFPCHRPWGVGRGGGSGHNQIMAKEKL